MNKVNTPKILIVDDEIDLLDIYEDSLEQIEYQVVRAQNGQEALGLVRNGVADGVITDLSMPVMGGLDFIREVRQLGIQIPIAIISGYGDKNSVIEALRLGVLEFIEKPIDVSRFKDIAKKVGTFGLKISEMSLSDQDSEVAKAKYYLEMIKTRKSS